MEMFNGLPDAIAAFRAYERDRQNDGTLPEYLMENITNIAGEVSPAVVISNGAEVLYANMDTCGKEGLELGTRLTALATQFGWHGLAVEDRGTRMVRAMCRELQIPPAIGSHQKKENDPAPKSVYAPPLVLVDESDEKEENEDGEEPSVG